MNLVKLPNRVLNLDNATEVILRVNRKGTREPTGILRVFWNVPAASDGRFDNDYTDLDGDAAEALRRHFNSLVAEGTIPDLTACAESGSSSTPGARSKDWRSAVSLGEALRGILGELGELSKASMRISRETDDPRLHTLSLVIREASRLVEHGMEDARIATVEGQTP